MNTGYNYHWYLFEKWYCYYLITKDKERCKSTRKQEELDGRNGKNKKEKQVKKKRKREKKGDVGCKGDTEKNRANGLCRQSFLGQS